MRSSSSHRKPVGFTLVEVLVVLVIISMITGMMVTAVRGVTTTAKIARTRSVIATIDSVIREQFESYKYRSFPVEILNRDVFVTGGTLGIEVLANEAARVRLIMNRDLQRMEMPDRFSDILINQAAIYAAANPVLEDSGTGMVRGTRNDKSARNVAQVVWSSSPKRDVFLSRLGGTPDVANQGAECLYMIMSTAFVGGEPAIANIPTNHVGDTDGDGLPEIIDAWGQPLGFIRWPVGFFDPELSLNPGVLANLGPPDDFDPFRVDFSYTATASPSTANPVDVNNLIIVAPNPPRPAPTHPWSIRPLVVSSGPDGAFGIATSPYTSSAGVPIVDFNYLNAAFNFPDVTNAVATAFLGAEATGRTGVYFFPDPYLRRFQNINNDALFPGQGLPGSGELDNRSDNITNFSLEVSR